jgi:hypothetical protein
MKQQTAVEWFHQKTWALKIQLELGEILIGEYANTYATLYNQAKEMEKEQIVKAANFDSKSISENGYRKGEQYYNETFNTNEE